LFPTTNGTDEASVTGHKSEAHLLLQSWLLWPYSNNAARVANFSGFILMGIEAHLSTSFLLHLLRLLLVVIRTDAQIESKLRVSLVMSCILE